MDGNSDIRLIRQWGASAGARLVPCGGVVSTHVLAQPHVALRPRRRHEHLPDKATHRPVASASQLCGVGRVGQRRAHLAAQRPQRPQLGHGRRDLPYRVVQLDARARLVRLGDVPPQWAEREERVVDVRIELVALWRAGGVSAQRGGRFVRPSRAGQPVIHARRGAHLVENDPRPICRARRGERLGHRVESLHVEVARREVGAHGRAAAGDRREQ